MLERKLFSKNVVTTAVAALSIVTLASCGKKEGSTNVTAQGTVQLENLKVGTPESTFKDAAITFVVDNKAAATAGGKTQYISRSYNAKHGQYLAQCKDGKCFALQVLFAAPTAEPITKEEADEQLKALLPTDAPAVTKTDDSFKAKTKKEIVEFGDSYTGVLDFEGDKVKEVTALAMSPSDVHDMMLGKKPKVKPASAAESTETKTEKTETK